MTCQIGPVGGGGIRWHRIGGFGVEASCRLGEMLLERVENRRVGAFELDLGGLSYILMPGPPGK